MKKTGIVILALLMLSLSVPLAFAKYDEWGYNYQANMFNGWYENYQRPDPPLETGETHLMMKWNDAWMNEDKVRHEGYPSYDNSGAWLTNHMFGTYEDGTKWQYFVKIITPSSDAGDHKGVVADGEDPAMWYHADGSEIGQVIWGAFAIIQDQENNRGHTVFYKSPSPVGFGAYPAY